MGSLIGYLLLIQTVFGLHTLQKRHHRRCHQQFGGMTLEGRGVLHLETFGGVLSKLDMANIGDSVEQGDSDSSSSECVEKESDEEGSIDLLFDGECPICMMEVEFLKKRDLKSRIRFTNLRDPGYNPADHGDVTFEDGMRKLRAVLPDGKVVMGVEVFRQTYKAIGLGWVFDLTKVPLIGKVADNLYDVWAANRLRLTGKGELADILVARAKELRELAPVGDCEEECGLDFDDL